VLELPDGALDRLQLGAAVVAAGLEDRPFGGLPGLVGVEVGTGQVGAVEAVRCHRFDAAGLGAGEGCGAAAQRLQRGGGRGCGSLAVDGVCEDGVGGVPGIDVGHDRAVRVGLGGGEGHLAGLGVAGLEQRVALEIAQVLLHPAEEVVPAGAEDGVAVVLDPVAPRVDGGIQQVQQGAEEVLLAAVRGGGQQQQVVACLRQLLRRPQVLRRWGKPVGLIEHRQRPRPSAPDDLPPDVGVVCVQVDGRHPDVHVAAQIEGIAADLRRDAVGIDAEEPVQLPDPLLDKMRRDDDHRLARNQTSPAALGEVHAGHERLPGARLVRQQERRRGGGSIAPKTASSWCAKGRNGRVASTADRIRGIAHSIHFAHTAVIALSPAPLPSWTDTLCWATSLGRRNTSTRPRVGDLMMHSNPDGVAVTAATVTSSPSRRIRSSLASSVVPTHASPLRRWLYLSRQSAALRACMGPIRRDRAVSCQPAGSHRHRRRPGGLSVGVSSGRISAALVD